MKTNRGLLEGKLQLAIDRLLMAESDPQTTPDEISYLQKRVSDLCEELDTIGGN